MNDGIIFDIKRYAINDGPGIRTAVFFKGCPLRCWWCHNPEGQSYQPQLMFRQNRCKASLACVVACPQNAIRWEDGPVTGWDRCDHCGKCTEVCYSGAREIVGRPVATAELMAEVERDVPFYDQSGGGVTFTGGEPMAQVEFLVEMLRLSKRQQISTVLDTSGHTSWENMKLVLPFVDLFLYDLKMMDDGKHKMYTSVSNRLILGNLQKLSAAGAALVVRIPIIPGINDDKENIEQSAEFLAGLPVLQGVEVMPYHAIGVPKFQALGMSYKLEDITPPSNEKIAEVEGLISSYRLPVVKHPGRAL